MQDTSPCEPDYTPAPAQPSPPPSISEMATKALRIPTPKESSKEQLVMNLSQNNNNAVTKETKQTKDNSIVEDVCRDKVKGRSSNAQNLVQRNTNSEDESFFLQDAHNDSEQDSCRGDTKYTCPICDTVLFSSHDFTIHIRSHNNSSPEDLESTGKGCVCRVCGKVLSSASSLDRHVLVHSGERAFKCKICGFSFTTSGNMRRHMRTHTSAENGDSFSYDSDVSSDSLGSSKPQSPPPLLNLKKRRVSRTASEFNNNIIELSPPLSTDISIKRKSDADDLSSARKRKCDSKKSFIEKFDCSLCDKTNFFTLNLLETHIEECHPEYKAKCDPCNLIFKNHRVLNLHRYMVHHTEIKEHFFANAKQETIGFKDITFVDFSSEKFPHIARAMCEQSLHHASSLHHRFQCEKCDRAFPCGSALNIHQQNCGNENYASSGESYHQDNDLSSSDNEIPTDLSSAGKRTSWGETKVSDSSDDIEDERKRYNFFACLDLQNKTTSSPNQHCHPVSGRVTRESFFNMNNGENKDLADIQSIISVASSGGLLHDLSKSPQPTVLEVTPPDSGSRMGMYDATVADEEQQDCFAAEFRKMKLRGEFPCRLCTAVFPNLRALKGHNRVHLSSNGGQNTAPYRCNMCPHFSSDKSALIRHMRTHNGDRPYECALCHYAFTTKANCERHLRNRHAKMTREEVKKSIIYHPSEDPTNEADHKPSRDDVKRSLFNEKETPKRIENVERLKTENVPNFIKPIVEKNPNVFEAIQLQQPSAFTQVKKVAYVQELGNIESIQRKSLDVGTMTYENSDQVLQNSNHTVSNFDPPLMSKTEIERDIPLDLSMDALDLSKKKTNLMQTNDDEELSESDEELRPQDLSKKSRPLPEKNMYPLSVETIERSKKVNQSLPSRFHQEVKVCIPSPSHHPLDKESPVPLDASSMPKFDLSKFYPSNTHPFYLNNTTPFPPFSPATPLPSGPYPSYFIPPPPPVLFSANPNQDLTEMKERLQKELIRGLQLTSGGSLVFDQITMANAADRIQALHQQAMAEMSWRMENTKEERSVYVPPVKKEVSQPDVSAKETAIKSQDIKREQILKKVELLNTKQENSSASVKMVIKNGVLIPKQKQRRYRTERPFSCEHCSARFTLRSNMERHIKQQHPQFWTQRQRHAASIPTKRNPLLSSKLPQNLLNQGHFYSQNGLTGCNAKSEDEVSRSSISNDQSAFEKLSIGPEGKPFISDEVKNALAQQLKSKLPSTVLIDEEENYDDFMDEEEEEDLVIDEEIKEDDMKLNADDKETNKEITLRKKPSLKDENLDLASVSRILDNASTQTFRQYFRSDEDHIGGEGSEDDEEGLVAAGSTSEGCNSGSDERSESEINSGTNSTVVKKKSAYSLAPNRVSCPYCFRKFPWSSSLRRHVLTHTGQKPYKCSFCPLLFTTKSNCDRHLLRKHGGGGPTTSTEAQPVACSDPTSNQTNTSNYTMRNVPERPYKCKNCPSSTFSTLSNLKKHLSTKHQISVPCKSEGTQSGYESQGSISEELDVGDNENSKHDHDLEKRTIIDPREIHPGHPSENVPFFKTHPNPVEQNFVAAQPSDLPFKCHLCEGSFGERQEALDHIRDSHCAEFQLLVSKGALEVSATAEDSHTLEEGGEENLEQLRGKFPDYANRKVMCAFCLRRFWSAEDLRRHMRTHTGERPFSCDICRRRFTLKHSMLRHRKKHSFSAVGGASPASDDESGVPHATTTHNNNNNTIVTPKPWAKARQEEESDLISNLLGIQDKTIVDKMLISKSADDAAILLGVQK